MKRGEAGKQALAERFRRAKAEGDLPPHVDPEGLMRVLIAMLQGISVQATQGATREELDSVGRKPAWGCGRAPDFLSPPSNYFIVRYRIILDVE